ncbi:MAG: class I SAM-dependent methyltransferase [Vicinamibacterales bacterium]
MDLRELQRHWQAFGEQDPLWAILTDPARKGGRWTPEEFFATGVAEIDALMREAASFGLPRQRRRGLDFGCGVGRLTQALARHVDEAVGLDVAPSMVERARAFNQHGARVRYEVQAAPPLEAVPNRSIDVVYTGRVLQHIAPEYARQYIAELARIVAPGGFLSFDVPGRWLDEPAMPAGAMASGAYRARLDAVPHATASPGRAAFRITVTNTGSVAWPAGASINLGTRWLDAAGASAAPDGPRLPVPLPLVPGASASLDLDTPWPDAPEAVTLELDVVHEGVTWFAWQGSPPTTVARPGRATPGVAPGAEPAPAAPTPPPAGFDPVMEMHAVPRADVEAILANAGVTLLRVRPEAHCGPRWEAWRYDVTAGPAR